MEARIRACTQAHVDVSVLTKVSHTKLETGMRPILQVLFNTIQHFYNSSPVWLQSTIISRVHLTYQKSTISTTVHHFDNCPRGFYHCLPYLWYFSISTTVLQIDHRAKYIPQSTVYTIVPNKKYGPVCHIYQSPLYLP